MKKLALALLLVVAACTKKDDAGWLGYGEGDAAMIAAPQAGWVIDMKVERGQNVRAGDLLFVLDNTREQSSRDQAIDALNQAKASLTQEQANLTYARTELTRQDNLARAGAGVATQRDAALNTYRQSQARIGQLQAQIRQMEAQLTGAAYTLSQRRVVAQIDGPVQDIYFRRGEYVPAAVPVLSLLPPANVYVRFFVPEQQIARLHLGSLVRVTCDGCKPFDAKVSFIASQVEYTPPVIFSEGNREKLVFKLEARSPGGVPLHPGQPVEVRPL
jgi:HlyD family secretion protein